MSRRRPSVQFDPVKNEERSESNGKGQPVRQAPLKPEDQEGVLWRGLRPE